MKYFIYFIVIVAFLDTFSQLPIMSTFAQSLGGTPLIIGLVVGMYSFANMIGNIIAGAAVDKFGAKNTLYKHGIYEFHSLVIYRCSKW